MAGLYGDWEGEMDQLGQGVDEAQASAAGPAKKKKKPYSKRRKEGVIKGEDYIKTAESKKGRAEAKKTIKKRQRRDKPYKGWKSDLAWIEKQKKKKK